MSTDTMAPASTPTGIERFLADSLATLTPADATSAAPATDTTPKPPADAAPASAAPSDGESAKETPDAMASKFEAVHKQLSEQTKANKKLGRSNVELLKQLSTLKAELQDLRSKYDGTYTPPTGPTPEQQQALVEFQAREAASRKVAEEKYGAEVIQAKIYAEDSPYKQLISDTPWIHQRVLTSDTPILEALQALEEFEVLNTYGRSSAAVLENVTKQVKDHLWTQWTQQAHTAAETKPGGTVPTLGDARGQADGQSPARPVAVFDPASFNRHIA